MLLFCVSCFVQASLFVYFWKNQLKMNVMKKTILLLSLIGLFPFIPTLAQKTQKPVLHAKHWLAITGKPLGATAGASIFNQGGNAVDAACAMLAATCTMWDVLSWGG